MMQQRRQSTFKTTTWKSTDIFHKRNTFQTRMELIRSFSCALMGLDRSDYGKLMAFEISFWNKEVIQEISAVHNKKLHFDNTTLHFYADDILEFHCGLNSSWAKTKRSISGFKRMLRKQKTKTRYKFAGTVKL